MNSVRFALNGLWREARGGELLVLGAALIIAVASITAIGFLTDRIGQAVERQAVEVLAADIRLRSGRPMDQARLDAADSAGLRTAQTINMATVVFSGDQRALANLKAVSEGYPLRGELRIADRLFGDTRVTGDVPARGEVWADAGLLARLGADTGADLDIGTGTFRISRVLIYRPDQSPGFTALAPALLMHIDDLAATGLIQPGSRVNYAQLFAGSADAVAAFRADLDGALPDGVRLEDRGDAGRELTAAIDRASRFLALASLVSLILAAVAVAMAARRYAERRLDTAALMKSFGAEQRFILRVGIIQLLVIGLVASLVGSAVGYLAERGLSALLSGLLRGDLPNPGPQPVALGFATALILLAGFALPSLLRLRETPPLRVLRHDLAPPPPGIWISYGFALLSLGALVFWAVRDVMLLVVILGGTLAMMAALYAGGRLLVWVLSRLRGRVGVAWRYGLANVARRGGDSAVQVVAFGLGLMVLLLLTLVRNDLLSGWRATIDDNAPNQFLINIQPGERDSVREIFESAGLGTPAFVPLVRGRVSAVNGVGADDWQPAEREGRRRVGRETNLTYASELDPSNRIAAGKFWAPDYTGPPQVSVDADIARDMGIGPGDTLTFDIAGEELAATVTSTREIDWDSFRPNFFMVLSANGMEVFPQTFITSMYVPDGNTATLLRLVRAHPSISVIDIEAAIAQVRSVIDKASLAVQYVFLFTLAAGLVVLFAAIQSTLDERRYESALLRTFGASRRTVLGGILSEFSALGLLAGFFAATGATVIGMVAARELFDLDYTPDPLLWFAGIVAGVVIVGFSGTLAARSAAETAPIQTLRRH
jgi:putative ABC transport system permease protein